ncbi:MAG: hydroxypyruvate isomerase family protein [Paracoccaceae bacterium]
MTPLSANLGFLWSEHPLPEAVRRAKAAGFDAVELHWPFDTDPADLRAALDETGLPVIGLNTRKGTREGDVGLAAQPGREAEARAAIDEAFDYGAAIGARAVHVMAGTLKGQDPETCTRVFAENLAHACDRAAAAGMTALIEPLNPYDNPDYALMGLDNALGLLDRVGRAELKVMFDCYHLQITDGDLLRRFRGCRERVGHVQFAAVPDRTEPDAGEVAYAWLLPRLAEAGFDGPFGAEYKPRAGTDEGLGWMATVRSG